MTQTAIYKNKSQIKRQIMMARLLGGVGALVALVSFGLVISASAPIYSLMVTMLAIYGLWRIKIRVGYLRQVFRNLI